MNKQMQVVVDAGNRLGESVLWCMRSQRVFWTDILGASLYAHDACTGATTCWPMPERLASFALTSTDKCLLLGLASGLAFFDLERGAATPLHDVEPGLPTRLNDGRCDRAGNFVFGTMCEAEPRRPMGAFYRLNAEGLALERLALHPVAIPNSICFSPDGATMYYCDSPERTIRCCDYPSLANDRLFARVTGQGEPDGSCIDAAGYLWNAQWGAGAVVRYTPYGVIDRVLATPARQPSCVTFGGPALAHLYCSSATVGLDAPTSADGALMACAPEGIRGLEESVFRC